MAPLPDDGFERRAPSRHPEGSQPGDQPDWLTGSSAEAPQDEAPSEARPADFRPGRQTRPEETWENAVDRAGSAEAFQEGEPGAWRYAGAGASKPKTSTAAGFSPQALLSQLSKYPPLLIVAVVAIAVVAVLMFRPREEQTTSIAAIHKYPERFEGRQVKVKGKVGEVFEVGGGYAFHLQQGREDIVVFTRSRVPTRREVLTITGSISSGVLDGKSRQALFETTR